MTYCLAIKVKDGIVFATDSRTNAGVDYVSTYHKMHLFEIAVDRFFVLLAAGNLATSQAVVNAIRRDMETGEANGGLRGHRYLFDAAHYIGEISQRVQQEHRESLERSQLNPEASFILGGQIDGRPPNIYLIYPQGNYITASEESPYLQIGETKYGKPILDRVIRPDTPLEDAARCALVSLDSTMRSNISVGPPLDLLIYPKDRFQAGRRLSLTPAAPLFTQLQKSWNEGIRRAFDGLPRFDWEN